jgi:hypothetical protein
MISFFLERHTWAAISSQSAFHNLSYIVVTMQFSYDSGKKKKKTRGAPYLSVWAAFRKKKGPGYDFTRA